MEQIERRLEYRKAILAIEAEALADETKWLATMIEDFQTLDAADPEARRIFYSMINKGA